MDLTLYIHGGSRARPGFSGHLYTMDPKVHLYRQRGDSHPLSTMDANSHTGGTIFIDGESLMGLDRRLVAGKLIALVYRDGDRALDPGLLGVPVVREWR